jgi:glycosyltransferase involved in cell wall biosynthesis
VDRVSLAYLAHFESEAWALLRHRRHWLALSRASSQRIFCALQRACPQAAQTIRREALRGHITRGRHPKDAWFLNTGHSGLEEAHYVGQLSRRRYRPVYFLHDLIPITHPEYCRAGDADRHIRRVTHMLQTARGLIVNSVATYDELWEFRHRHGLPSPPVLVAPLGFSLPSTAGPQPLLSRPYFLQLGTIEPRKNHLLTLQVWRRLAERLGPDCPTLVLIGRRGWECEQVVDLLDRTPALASHVVEIPHADDARLATWIAHAKALLFPSFTEGFGLPVLEALALRVPVLASDLAVFRELAGEIPDYLDPLDGLGWLQAVCDYLDSTHPRGIAQRERMRDFKAPSWGGHFALIDDFLAHLA